VAGWQQMVVHVCPGTHPLRQLQPVTGLHLLAGDIGEILDPDVRHMTQLWHRRDQLGTTEGRDGSTACGVDAHRNRAAGGDNLNEGQASSHRMDFNMTALARQASAVYRDPMPIVAPFLSGYFFTSPQISFTPATAPNSAEAS
jgi:hypothetical protein